MVPSQTKRPLIFGILSYVYLSLFYLPRLSLTISCKLLVMFIPNYFIVFSKFPSNCIFFLSSSERFHSRHSYFSQFIFNPEISSDVFRCSLILPIVSSGFLITNNVSSANLFYYFSTLYSFDLFLTVDHAEMSSASSCLVVKFWECACLIRDSSKMCHFILCK